MTTHWFKTLFAATGTKTAVPDAADPSGFISYDTGYGPDYQRVLGTDPLAKTIERDKLNQVLYDMTGVLQQYQVNGFPEYIDATANGGTAYAYPLDALVRFTDGLNYRNTVASNTNAPNVSGWVLYNNPASSINSATAKTTPVDADLIGLVDSAASFALKKTTWANIKATILSSFGVMISTATAKTVPVDADIFIIGDSAATNASKKTTWANIKATLKTYFDTLYPSISGNPAISVYLSSQQNITSATWTKISFAAEIYDTTSAFDPVTNFRFTPLVAGKYHIDACATLNGVGSTRAGIRIYKNGALHKHGNVLDTPSTSNDQVRTASADVGMNGTTDYIEVYVFINGTSTVVGAGLESTYLNAHLIIGA